MALAPFHNTDTTMASQEGVMPQSFHIEVDQESSIEYILKPTAVSEKEMTPAGFKQNIKSLMENLGIGSIEEFEGMRAQVNVQEDKKSDFKNEIKEKPWVEIG